MTAGNQVIGMDKCFDCRVAVEVRVNKNRRAYYFCDGVISSGGAGCGAHARWSQKSSAVMIAAAAQPE